ARVARMVAAERRGALADLGLELGRRRMSGRPAAPAGVPNRTESGLPTGRHDMTPDRLSPITVALAGAFAAAAFAAGLGAAAAPACADTLALKDGRTVEGRVVKDGETYRVVSRFGETEVAAKDVATWTKSAPLETEWRARSAKLDPKDAAGRADLAKWLADAGRPDEAAATARAALE